MSTDAGAWLAPAIAPRWALRVVPTKRIDAPDERPLDGLDDRELVAACLAGRLEAFDLIVERHRRHVYQLCYRFAGKHEDAADYSQEVFLRAYRGLARFRGDSSIATWLYRIGVNVCLNKVSARQPAQQSIDDAPPLAATGRDAASELIRGEQAARVRAAVARLPRKQRATLILRVYHDLSHQEIATVLGTSVGAVKANVFHALGNLKKLLAGEPK
jgi:RNA polymerase sigma-70 factor (ECF subfamily)